MPSPTIPIRLIDPPNYLAGDGFVLAVRPGRPPRTIRERTSRTRWAMVGWADDRPEVALYVRG